MIDLPNRSIFSTYEQKLKDQARENANEIFAIANVSKRTFNISPTE